MGPGAHLQLACQLTPTQQRSIAMRALFRASLRVEDPRRACQAPSSLQPPQSWALPVAS